VAAVGFVPFRDLLQTSSVEAVINARVIVNHRADRSRIDDLTHQIVQVKDERSGIAVRLANARMLLNDLTEQTHLFSEARILPIRAAVRDHGKGDLFSSDTGSIAA